MKVISIKRPPNKFIQIKLPISEDDCPEDEWLNNLITETKIEPRMAYVVNQILEDYYYWVDMCFHKRAVKRAVNNKDFWVLFTMREVIDWICRTSPIKIRTFVEKETQKVWFADWNISQNVEGVDFPYQGQRYNTNLYWIYASRFRDAMFPNSNFNWFALQKRQREASIRRGRITVIMCSRWWGKSYYNIAFVSTYLFKELNMDFEFTRPFLIVYGGLSREANLQVVEYIRAMAKTLTTNKNILKRDKWEQVLTLYDGHNERKIKFVSQGQEGAWFTGLRPHLVVLDECARLDKRMFTVAIGTSEAHIVLISTIDYTDRRNRFYYLYLEAVKKQRSYKDPLELIAETWIKFWMHKLKTQKEYEQAVRSGVILAMREYFYSQRPLVWLKYTIEDVEYLTQQQKDELIERSMMDWEDQCLAEYFSEYSDNHQVFNTEWLLESKMPERFDRISFWFDEAEEIDNPAIVFAWVSGKTTYVIHSEVLDKEDYLKRYNRINELIRLYSWKTSFPLIFAMDLTRTQKLWLREIEEFVRMPEYPILYTSSQQDDIKRKRPFYLIGKKRLVTIIQDEYFKKWCIIFDWNLDIEDGLIEEISNFKRWTRWKIEWAKKQPDDQVNAMMVALYALFDSYLRDKFTPKQMAWWVSQEQRIDEVIMRKESQATQAERESHITYIINNYW